MQIDNHTIFRLASFRVLHYDIINTVMAITFRVQIRCNRTIAHIASILIKPIIRIISFVATINLNDRSFAITTITRFITGANI